VESSDVRFSREKEQKMTRRKRRNHSSAFKAKVALAADRACEPGLGNGHLLYPDGQGVHVSDGHHGLAFAPGAVLAGIEHLGYGLLYRGAGRVPTALWNAGDLQHRPTCPVHLQQRGRTLKDVCNRQY
jgi:hypothetical protein